jgi:TM2 domain-containing membrane protein YozV
MNCNYHPEVPSSAFCQFCGKPLCKDCVRNVGGSVFCEACLTERLRGSGVGAPSPIFTGTPHPMLAALLGMIPGVGAMYNGQYAKAIAHVLIFAVLISLSDHTSGVFGILVAAWVVYQVFDAYQTALARRDGHPLPNPFGLNDIAQRLGIHPHPGVPPVPPVPPAGSANWGSVAGAPQPGQPQYGQGPAAGFAPPSGAGYAPGYPPAPGQPGYAEWLENDIRQRSGATPGPGQPGYSYVPGQPYPPVPPMPPFPPAGGYMGGRDVPTGAIILIGLGILFLFGSLGLLHHDWIAHGWPLLIIGLGIWIIFRRTQNGPPAVPPPDPSSIHSPGHTHSVPTHSGTDTTGGSR